jgi:ligand-binding sensor domain-containing protein
MQDRIGNMWFATLDGLYMFNGKVWEEYKQKTFRVKKVYDLEESNSGDVWVATEAGVAKYTNGEWVLYSKKDGLSGNAVYRLEEDRSGRIWAFSRSDLKYTGLSLYDNGTWQDFNPQEIGLKGKIETLLYENDEVIVYSREGIARYANDQWHVFKKGDGLPGDNFALLYRDKARELWTANEHGLYKYKDGQWTAIFNPKSKWKVNQIYHDDSGSIWVGTDKQGVFRQEGDEWIQYTDDSSLADNEIFSIFEDKQQNIWVTTKKGITRFSFTSGNLNHQ